MFWQFVYFLHASVWGSFFIKGKLSALNPSPFLLSSQVSCCLRCQCGVCGIEKTVMFEILVKVGKLCATYSN